MPWSSLSLVRNRHIGDLVVVVKKKRNRQFDREQFQTTQAHGTPNEEYSEYSPVRLRRHYPRTISVCIVEGPASLLMENGVPSSYPPERWTYPRACRHSSMWSCTVNTLPVWGSPSCPPCLARSSQTARSCWRPPIPFTGCSHLVMPQPATNPRMQAARHRLPFRNENAFTVSNLIQSPLSLPGDPNRDF